MKVIIVRNAFSYDFGGAERLAVHLAKELTVHGIEVAVISSQDKLLSYASANQIEHKKGWWWSEQNWSGKRVLLFPVYFIWQILLFFWYLLTIRALKPDIVHLMSKDDFIAGTFAARLLGAKVFWTDTADLKHIFFNHSIWFKNPVGKLVYTASKYADFVGLVSNSEKHLVEESLGRSAPPQFQVMHIAGKDEPIKPASRSREDQAAVIFCSTSRLVEAKGINELVEAFNMLSQESNGYRLWLVGDGPDRKKFEDKVADNSFITFFGHSESPLSYVAACDVFVHPTHHEGFSLSLTEAAMLGKPLLATDVGGNPEMVNDANGILVPVKNVDKLYEAMRRLGTDKKLREKLGSRARSDYKNNFDFSFIVKDKLIPLYKSLGRRAKHR